MKIGMVLYEPQEIGGLEEYAVTLAIGLCERGHPVSVLCATWTPPTNQYLRRLRDHGVPVVQPPQWLSQPASHWPTKQRILALLLRCATPLIYGVATGLFWRRRCLWSQAYTSAYGWLRGQLQHRLTGPDRRQPLARLLLAWWRWRWRPDLIHMQGYTTTLLFAVDWAAAHHLPVVYEEHQTPDAQFDWWQGFHQSINKAATVIAVSETSAQALRTVCGITQPIVVRNPLLPDPVYTGWHKATPSGTAGLRVTTVARLAVAKGLPYLLEAIVQVQKRYPTTQFHVYGDGDLRASLLAYADQLGLDGEAIFIGPFTSREELAQIMAQTDLFVLPSLLEGQPLALVEAMAYSCPIVATPVGGVPELIQDGVNGLLCPPKDAAALAAMICQLLADPVLRQQLGGAARHTYEQSPFQPAALCTHFIAIYAEVLSRASVHGGQRHELAPTLHSNA